MGVGDDRCEWPAFREEQRRLLVGRLIVGLVAKGWRPPPLRSEQTDRLLDDLARVHPGSSLVLTSRQARVLELLAAGLTGAQTGQRLGITPDSVKQHVRVAREKLGAANTTHAVAIALDMGLIELPGRGES